MNTAEVGDLVEFCNNPRKQKGLALVVEVAKDNRHFTVSWVSFEEEGHRFSAAGLLGLMQIFYLNHPMDRARWTKLS